MKKITLFTLIPVFLFAVCTGAFLFFRTDVTFGKTETTASEVSASDRAELPALKSMQSYTAEALPEFMDDLWVPWTDDEPVIVYKDKRNNLYGVADEKGNIKIEAVCPYILDQRDRGRIQNIAGLALFIVCADAPVNYAKAGKIDLKKNIIDWGNSFLGSGIVHVLAESDGMIIFQDSNTTIHPKYGYMDKYDNIVLKSQYNGATNFYEGYATVSMAGKWQIIEKDGSYPFMKRSWRTVQQLKGRTFIGQTLEGKWYRFEMPVSNKNPQIAITKNHVSFEINDYGDISVIIKNPVRNTGSYQNNQKVIPYPDTVGMYRRNCKMPYYLVPGNHAEVINAKGLKLHREAAGEEIKGIQAFPGKDIMILDGPVCKEGVNWFEIDFLGHKGWCMEGEKDTYYLRKTNGAPSVPDPSISADVSCKRDGNGRITTCLRIGDTVEVVNTSGLQMFQKANWAPIDTLQAFPGKSAAVTDGPQFVNGAVWWEIDFLGHRGWVMERSGSGKTYLEKK